MMPVSDDTRVNFMYRVRTVSEDTFHTFKTTENTSFTLRTLYIMSNSETGTCYKQVICTDFLEYINELIEKLI